MCRTKFDLTGQRFGRLVVLGKAEEQTKKHKVEWTCQCDCGNTKPVVTGKLRSGYTRSCGCLQRERMEANRQASPRKQEAMVYLRTNPTASIREVMKALDCSNRVVMNARDALGLSSNPRAVTDELLKEIGAYQMQHPTAPRDELRQHFGVSEAAVDKARKLVGWTRPRLEDSPEYQAAVEYVDSTDRRVKAREIREKFGLSINASTQVAAMQGGYEMSGRNNPQPLSECDYGPNYDKRRFIALTLPMNRLAEAFGVAA